MGARGAIPGEGSLGLLHRSSTAFYDSLLAPLSWAASQLLTSLGLADIKELLFSFIPIETFVCGVRLCLRLAVPFGCHRAVAIAGVGGSGRALLVFLVGAYLSLADPIHALLSFMDRFVAFLAAHTALLLSLYLFDPSLLWSNVSWAQGCHLEDKRGSYTIDYRAWLLYLLYPLAAVAFSLLLGCVSSSITFSRGVRVGRRLDLFDILTECVPAALRSCST